MKLPYIIAVDFDGTLVNDEYPEIGYIYTDLWEQLVALKQQYKNELRLVLWTCRTDDKLDAAVQFCKNNGLEFDEINDQVSEIKTKWGNARKIYADMYIDDKSVHITGIEFALQQTLGRMYPKLEDF